MAQSRESWYKERNNDYAVADAVELAQLATTLTVGNEGLEVYQQDTNTFLVWDGTTFNERLSGVGIPGNEINASVSQQTVTLPDSTENLGESFTVSNADNGVEFDTANGELVTGDLDHTETGSVLITVPSTERVEGALVNIVEQPINQPNTVVWNISPNVTLQRGNNGGLYNPAAGQTSWSGNNATGTLWRNDINTTPQGFSDSYGGSIGNNILEPLYDNVFVTDTVTGIEYGPFTFTEWQQGGGGGFAVSDQTATPEIYRPSWDVIDPRPEVRVANSANNTFDALLYEGAHDHLTIINTSRDIELPIVNLANGNHTLGRREMISIARINGEWYREGVESQQNFRRLIENGNFDLSNAATGNTTLVSVLADGGVTITHGDGNIGGFASGTTTLADGEMQLFQLSSVLGWLPVGGDDDTSGTTAIAVNEFTTTNGIKVPVGGFYNLFPDGTTYGTPTVTEYNEFINNFGPQYINISYEDDGGSSLRMNVNGVDATYTDLQNATDIGGGQVNFGGGVNGQFTRLARVDAEVLRNVGDYVEVIAPNVGTFSQMIVGITQNTVDRAHNTSGIYNLRFTAGSNGNVESYNFRDKTNSVVVSGGETNATYRFTRTLAGISFTRNGEELYCTSVTEFTDYRPEVPTAICNPLFGESGSININTGPNNIPVSWTPNALGDYTVEVTGINPGGANDQGHIRIGTTGVGSTEVFNGTAPADRFGDTSPLTRQYTFTVTSLVEHTLTFGLGGNSSFENVTVATISCPEGAIELPQEFVQKVPTHHIQFGTNVAGTVTFDEPFATAPVITFGESSTDGGSRSASTTNITATGFTFINHVVGTGVESALPVGWIAIGTKG